MIHSLPSFQIEVTEESDSGAKNYIHRKAVHTTRLCRDINPQANCVDHIQIEKPKVELLNMVPSKSFYTNIAKELSALNDEQLIANFSDLRVCFKHTRSEKKYAFTF